MKKNIFLVIKICFIISFLVIGLNQVQAQDQAKRNLISTKDPAFRICLTGSAKLVQGKAEIKFNKEYLSKFINRNLDIKILVTPVGSWSGIYVMSMDKDGFTVKSDTGDQNVLFNWILVGEKKRTLSEVGR